jgi:hypothetical protein
MSSESPTCLSCRGAVPPGAKFCRACGAPVPDQRSVACPRCQHPNPPDSKFCRACGSQLGSATQPIASAAEPTRTDVQRPGGQTPPVDPTAHRGAAAPPEPSSPSRRWIPVAAALAALVVAAGATAGVVAVVQTRHTSTRSSPPTTAAVTTTTAQSTTTVSASNSTESSSTDASSTTATTQSSPPSTPAYNEGDFVATPPASWKRVEDGKQHDTYVESKWLSPGDPNDFVLVDMSPGSGLPPHQAASVVRAAVRREAGYQEVSFGSAADLNQTSGTEWTFKLPGSERVDYFFSACGHDFAVLGASEPSSFGQMLSTFTTFANSVQGTCGQ